MNISIEKDRDFSDYELHSKGSPNDKFKISRTGDDSPNHDRDMHLSFPNDGRPKLSLETEGVDLLFNDTGTTRKKETSKNEQERRPHEPQHEFRHDHDDDRRSTSSNDYRHHEDVPSNITIKDNGGEAVTEIQFASDPDSPVGHVESPKKHSFHQYEESPFESRRPRHDNWQDRYDTRSEVSAPPAPRYTPEELLRHKREILFHLDRLERKGVYLPTKYTLDSDLEEMRTEYERLKTQTDTDKAIKFYQNMLMAFVSGAEFLNENYNPYKLKLDGWSESVIEKVDDYDDVFEELHVKYSTKMKLAPELRLLGMVVGSGFMTHLTNSIFKSSTLPAFGDVMKQNPDLMRQFQAAAVNTATNQTPAMGGIFGMMNQMGANIPTPAAARAAPPPSNQPHAVPQGRSSETTAHAAGRTAGAPIQRKEMRGPSNVDDILQSFAPVNAPKNNSNANKPDDIKSVNLSELNDFDRISEISSMDEADLHNSRNPMSRPTLGMRPTHRDAFISRMKTRKRGKKDGGLIIDI